jgi:hypothetical protein
VKRLPTPALLGILSTVLALLLAVATPVNPSNKPTPLPDRTNGKVPNEDLITVAPQCAVARAAGPSLYRLFALARAYNVPLGTNDCYRPLKDQVAVGNSWTARGNSACAASVKTSPSGQPVGTSMHGWGKAVDFADGRAGMRFGSPGYQFLKAQAARVGWNHPGWAEPGGSKCPEAWHWEWVGDGGSQGADTIRADVVALLPSKDGHGYATVNGLGGMVHRGSSVDRGSAIALPLGWVVIGGTRTPSGNGYWLVGGDGGVFTYGDAPFVGSTGDRVLNAPIVTMASTPTGKGYWLIASDGGVFTFGDAKFFGSTGDRVLNSPIVAMASTPTGKGYWLVAGDGGVFTFGDAKFFGSTGGQHLNSPIVTMASTPSGKGYWMVAADGGVFTFGDAPFFGSAANAAATAPVVAMAATPSGRGYWLAGAGGGVFTYGDATSYGAA